MNHRIHNIITIAVATVLIFATIAAGRIAGQAPDASTVRIVGLTASLFSALLVFFLLFGLTASWTTPAE